MLCVHINTVYYSEEQYFYSIFVPRRKVSYADTRPHPVAVARNTSDGHLYCGPIPPAYILNPMNGLAQEYTDAGSYTTAMIIKLFASNACILSLLFILA